MRDIRGSPHHRSRIDISGLIAHNHARLSGYDHVQFVRTGMQVDFLRLSGFEAIESYKEKVAPEQVRLGRCVGCELG
jgi:hypothetical protein